MIVAIMQPYFFPYIGYFQLLHAADLFVFYDDAQYMKGGWVNRNRILRNAAPAWWTLPIVRDDYRLPIRERRYARTADNVSSLLGKLEGAYRGAPHYAVARARVEACFADGEDRVSLFNQSHLTALARELGIGCEVVTSSAIDKDPALSGQARVIDLCKRLGATRYVNAIGGLDLYDPAVFADAGIELGFVRPAPAPYPQFGAVHVPYLSIVDLLMFNTLDQVRAQLDFYDIVSSVA